MHAEAESEKSSTKVFGAFDIDGGRTIVAEAVIPNSIATENLTEPLTSPKYDTYESCLFLEIRLLPLREPADTLMSASTFKSFRSFNRFPSAFEPVRVGLSSTVG